MAKEAHSAIPSWSGYIYQGKIAFYHVLRIIAKKLAQDQHFNFTNFSLEVEWQEDFAIKVGKKYESVHQVKAYQDNTNVTEYKKAISGLLRKVQSHYTKGYLHILTPIAYNTSITDFPTYQQKNFYINYYPKKYIKNVNLYSYCTHSITCNLDEVDSLILQKIEDIYSHKDFGITSLTSKQYQYIQFQLYKLLDTHILEVHKQIRKKYQTIPFSDILEVFESNYEEYSEEYKHIKIKNNLFGMFNRYCSNPLNCSLNDCDHNCHLYLIEGELKSKTAAEIYKLVLQSTPHYDQRLETLMNTSGLIYGLTKAFHILDKRYQTSDYLYKKSNLYLPSTIHDQREIPNIAQQIIKNKALDTVLHSFEVDIFLSDDVSCANIFEAANLLKQVTGNGLEDLFAPERTDAINKMKKISIKPLNDHEVREELS